MFKTASLGFYKYLQSQHELVNNFAIKYDLDNMY